MSQKPDFVSCKGVFLKRQGQVSRRLVKGLLRQLESAPMHAHGLPGLQVKHESQGIVRVNVLPFHEIARQVGSDGQRQKIDLAKALSNRFEVRTLPGIAWEKKAPGIGGVGFMFHHIPAPQ